MLSNNFQYLIFFQVKDFDILHQYCLLCFLSCTAAYLRVSHA